MKTRYVVFPASRVEKVVKLFLRIMGDFRENTLGLGFSHSGLIKLA
jgi:hypothetical protein